MSRELESRRQQKERAEHAAREAMAVRDEFFAIATHDLKGPLQSILLSTQLLRRQLPPEAQTMALAPSAADCCTSRPTPRSLKLPLGCSASIFSQTSGCSNNPGAARSSGVSTCSAFTYMVSANSSRPISMRRISDVPAPISYSLASRHRRPSGYSLM